MAIDSFFNQTAVYQDLFLATKLQPTLSIHSLVSRPRLLERIDQGLEKKLTLICAPAGAGKTTLFSDWSQSAHADEVSIAWVSLDEGDNDPMRFWRYVCTALSWIHESVSEQLALLQQNLSDTSETMLIRLMNLLAESTVSFTLALDDYHLITNESIHQSLIFLLEHMPTNMHLVLLTRFEPALPLARLRVRSQVTEIREADLQFTPQEVEQFFIDSMGLPCAPEHIEALTQRTEGWIAGLQLAALAMRDCSHLDTFISSFTGSSRYIIDYLLEEVIDHLSEDVQTFLLSTSILNRLCASLCASLLGNQQELERQSLLNPSQPMSGDHHYQKMLERLERMNLFLVPLDQERRWYRYHQLFGEALFARLSQLHPSLVAELHVRASIWYEQHGSLTEAIEHTLIVGDVVRTCHLIERLTSTSFVDQDALAHWMQTLPEEEIRSRPRLCFLYAWVLILNGSAQWEIIEDWIEAGMHCLPQSQTISNEMTGEVAAVRALAASFRGEIEPALSQAQQALHLLPASHWQQSMMLLVLGATFSLAGDLDKATQTLPRAINSFQRKNLPCHFFGSIILAEIQAQQGYLDKSIQLFQNVIAERGNQSDNLIILAYGGLGNVLFERNELDMARSILEQGIHLYGKVGRASRTAASVYIPMARVQYAQGDVNAALATLASVELQARQDGSERVQAMAAAKRAHLHLQRGDMKAAVRWAEERELTIETAFHQSAQPDSREFEYIVLVRVLIAQGHYDQASHLLKGLFRVAHYAQRYASMIEIQILQALNEQAQGSLITALTVLERVLEQVQPDRYMRLFLDEGEPMRVLLSRMHAKDQQTQLYVKNIIDALRGSKAHVEWSSELPRCKSQQLLDPLSERELEVLHVLEIGETNAAIAKKLVIAPATVKRHMSNIFSKLGVENRTQAVARARDLNIL